MKEIILTETKQLPLIELDHISVTWQTGRRAYDLYRELSLSFDRGELYTIMGPSGSGKSTLLNLIAGFVRPTGGNVCVNGRNLLDMTAREMERYRNREIGFIFQSFNLIYAYTVLENVMTPLLIGGMDMAQARQKAAEKLELVGMADKQNARPATLSGGEQQRAAIARALVWDPPIILADEPTGNLDEENGLRIMKELECIHAAGKTLLVVTHDPAIGARGTRRINMKQLI